MSRTRRRWSSASRTAPWTCGHAAQRVRVLDLVGRGVMAALELAVAQEMAELPGDGDLARMRPRELVGRGEGDVRAEQRLDAHRGHDRRGPHQPIGVGEQERPDRAHQLRAVEQREALLRPELQRLEAEHRGGRRAAGTTWPSTSTWPRPMSGSARWASGARSPDAPTLPCSGTTGWMPCARNARRRSTINGRQPLWPSASVLARSRSIARTISRGNGAPDAGRVAHQQPALELGLIGRGRRTSSRGRRTRSSRRRPRHPRRRGSR